MMQMRCLVFSVCCLFFPLADRAQSPATSVPKTLYECDVLPSRKVCAVWSWDGKAYNATWPDTGAVGQMSVTRMDAGAVVITRKDISGATQGLTASYSGRWIGSAIVGGQVSWSWNGHAASNGWTGSTAPPAKDPEQIAAEKDAGEKFIPVQVIYGNVNGNDDKYGVKNIAGIPLTAYEVITISGRSGAEWAHMEDYRMTQADPLPRGQDRMERHIFPPGTMPSGLHVVAAIFSDGSVKGEAARVDSLMARRKEQLFTYRTMSKAICSMAQRQDSLTTMTTSLAAKKQEYVHSFPTMAGLDRAVEDAYAAVIHDLSDSSKNGGAGSAQKTLDDVMRMSNLLTLDPVRDTTGRLYLADAPLPAACRLD